MRTFSELVSLPTFRDRFEYLRLAGVVGEETFGNERYLNQRFYRSTEWRQTRDEVIARDQGYDLGIEFFIRGRYPLIHHMNPLTREDVVLGSDNLLDPEGLISCSLHTHNAIHYGDESHLPRVFVERSPGDTAPWRSSPIL